jgi:hypothetical protein
MGEKDEAARHSTQHQQLSNAREVASDLSETVMKTIQARVTKNIKEDPSIKECDIWNIQATFLGRLPDDAMRIIADPVKIGVNQLEAARIEQYAHCHYHTNAAKIMLTAW